jgi:hypothetical protein
MKKLLASLLLAIFVFTLFSGADAAVKKKKKKVIRRRHYRRIIRNWPKGGPRPVFPKAGDDRPVAAEPTPAPVLPTPPKPVADPPAKTFLFVEGGVAGGGAAAEVGYGRTLKEKLTLSGAVGYVFGVSNGIFVLDPVRLTCDLGNYMVGAGANCAFYNDKNLIGIEVFAAKQFNAKVSGKIGYSSALGLRAGLAYQF